MDSQAVSNFSSFSQRTTADISQLKVFKGRQSVAPKISIKDIDSPAGTILRKSTTRADLGGRRFSR